MRSSRRSAGSAGSVDRVDSLLDAFTLFLQEGCELAKRPPSALALEASAVCIHELVVAQMRRSSRPNFTTLQPHGTFIILAPFLGAEEANAFIERKLNA